VYFSCAIVGELKLEHLICIFSQECIVVELFVSSVPRLFVFSCIHREINGKRSQGRGNSEFAGEIAVAGLVILRVWKIWSETASVFVLGQR
jgi:hypothetical protein